MGRRAFPVVAEREGKAEQSCRGVDERRKESLSGRD